MTEPTSPARRLRFTIRTLLFVMLCVAGLLGGFRVGYERGFKSGAKQQRSERLFTEVYRVADLVLLTNANSSRKQADFDSLIETITTMVDPTTWDEVGGSGSIAPYIINHSLIISQTQEVHDRVAKLLEHLRKHPRPTLQGSGPFESAP